MHLYRLTNVSDEPARQSLASIRWHNRDLIYHSYSVLPLPVVTEGEWADH